MATSRTRRVVTICYSLQYAHGDLLLVVETVTSVDEPLVPFLKWAGGKRWLVPSILPLLAAPEGKYIEPFLGGGAVYFAHRPKRAILADNNSNLIRVFAAIRDQVEEVIESLSRMHICLDDFLRIRRENTDDPVQHAANFIYLNRTAFNGLYRVNRNGEFNVPFGCKPNTRLCDARVLRTCAAALRGAHLEISDFRESLHAAVMGDTVFVDPPYTIKSGNGSFNRYNDKLFAWADQADVAELCKSVVQQGARVVVTNASHLDVLSLYPPDLFTAWSVMRASRIAARSDRRGSSRELLLVSKTIERVPECSRTITLTPIDGRASSQVELLGPPR